MIHKQLPLAFVLPDQLVVSGAVPQPSPLSTTGVCPYWRLLETTCQDGVELCRETVTLVVGADRGTGTCRPRWNVFIGRSRGMTMFQFFFTKIDVEMKMACIIKITVHAYFIAGVLIHVNWDIFISKCLISAICSSQHQATT